MYILLFIRDVDALDITTIQHRNAWLQSHAVIMVMTCRSKRNNIL